MLLSFVRLGNCIQRGLHGLRGSLFRDELDYGQFFSHKAEIGGQRAIEVTRRTEDPHIFEVYSARLATPLHKYLASNLFVSEKKSPQTISLERISMQYSNRIKLI